MGTLVFMAVAAGAYLSFLLFIDWEKFVLERPEIEVFIQRLVFLAMAGNLANVLAEDLREQSEKHRRTAEHLAEANRQVLLAHEAVRRSDKLAALGQLTAGLAHELRNPLGTIKASAEMLNKQLSAENEVAREVAGFISTEVDRTNSLVTRFLQFARPLKLRMETADLAQLLDRAITDAEREAPGIAVYRNYAPEIPPFPFDAELMERVFYNLVLNAAQATAARRHGHGEDARRGPHRRDRRDRSRRGDRFRADEGHFQSVLHHQAGGSRTGPGDCGQDRGRTRR